MDWMWLVLGAVVIFFIYNGVRSSMQDKQDAEAVRQSKQVRRSEAGSSTAPMQHDNEPGMRSVHSALPHPRCCSISRGRRPARPTGSCSPMLRFSDSRQRSVGA